MKRFYNGLKLGLQGIIAKELRSRSRGWRSVAMLTGYLIALALGVAGFLALRTNQGDATITPMLGIQLFTVLALGFVVLLALVTPALTSGSISGERERKTLDLLMLTQASPLGVIIGKWMGSVFYILYLLAASLPAFAVVYLFGGVPLKHVGMVILVAAVTALTYSALGLLLSAIFKRTGVSSLVTYLLVFVLVLGLPFVGLMQASSSEVMMKYGGTPRLPTYAYASPLPAVSSVVPSTANQYYGGGNIIMEILQRGLAAMTPTSSVSATSFMRVNIIAQIDPQTGQPQFEEALAPWVYYFLLSGGVAVISIGWAALAVSPVKPLHAWLVRRRNRKRPVPATT